MERLDQPMRKIVDRFTTKFGEQFSLMERTMVSALQRVFKRSRVFLPVVHPISKDLCLKAVETALDCHADGIFLVNEGLDAWELLDLIPEIHHKFDSPWIGVNLIGFEPETVLGLTSGLPVAGIWSDNAGIIESQSTQPAAERFLQARQDNAWEGLFFGGVAMKYQRTVSEDNLAAASRKACSFMDVLTSSGAETGIAPSLDKVIRLREGAGSHALALASGISPENVSHFLHLVNAFLVASSIETEPNSGIFVPERVKLLADMIHGYGL
jgi:hypothetical protein